MPRRKNFILFTAVMVSSLVLAMLPVVNHASPAQAAGPTWTKYSGDVSLQSELYVADAWVLKDGGTYKMWYTHGETDLTIADLRDQLAGLNLDEIIDDIANTDLDELLDDMTNLDADDVLDFFDATSTVIGYATSTDSVNWTIQDSEVLAGGGDGLWSSVGLPCVIKDGSTYRMWYTNGETDLTRTQLQGILDDLDGDADTRKDALVDLLDSMETTIGYATSTNGTSWTVQGESVLSGDENWFSSVADPCVIKDGSTYKMWYTQLQTDLDRDDLGDILSDAADFDNSDMLSLLDGTETVIGYATSTDGSTWTVQNAQALAGNPGGLWESVADPSVIKDGTYQMWYTNIDTNLTQPTFSDMLQALRDLDLPSFLDSLASGNLDELLDDLTGLDTDDLEDLLSNTSTQIGYATSSDGSTWTVSDADDITGDSDGLWGGVGAPTAVKIGDSYKMWYTQGMDDLTTGNLLDFLQGTSLSLGYAYYSPTGIVGGGGGYVPEDFEDMSPGDAAAELLEMDPEDAAALLNELDPDDAAAILEQLDPEDAAEILAEMDADDVADILLEMDSGEAADILAEMDTGDAAAALEEMPTTDATDIMIEIGPDTLEDIIPDMSEETLTDTLPGLTPDMLYDIDPAVLFASLPNAPTEQLIGEDPPTPPEGAAPPVAIFTSDSGARYLAVQTWAGQWVVVMGTSEPIDQLMIKTKDALSNVETVLEIFPDYPPGVRARIPKGHKAYSYFTIDFDNAAPEDIEVGYMTFRVDQEWLEDYSIHKWAVVLNRYDDDLKAWTSLPTKRIDEDGDYVYYSSPISHFSIFSITGSAELAEKTFDINNLAVNPTDASTEQDITVTADITNLTSKQAWYVATLWIDDTIEAGQDVSVEAGQTKAVLFTVNRDAAGSYDIRLDRMFAGFDVAEVVKTPAAFTTSALRVTPAEIEAGEKVTVTVAVANTSELAGSYDVVLKVDAVVAGTEEITLDGGASGTVTFTVTGEAPGTYSVTVDGLTGTFTVREPAERPQAQAISWWRIGMLIAAITTAVVVPLMIRRRRNMA